MCAAYQPSFTLSCVKCCIVQVSGTRVPGVSARNDEIRTMFPVFRVVNMPGYRAVPLEVLGAAEPEEQIIILLNVAI